MLIGILEKFIYKSNAVEPQKSNPNYETIFHLIPTKNFEINSDNQTNNS